MLVILAVIPGRSERSNPEFIFQRAARRAFHQLFDHHFRALLSGSRNSPCAHCKACGEGADNMGDKLGDNLAKKLNALN